MKLRPGTSKHLLIAVLFAAIFSVALNFYNGASAQPSSEPEIIPTPPSSVADSEEIDSEDSEVKHHSILFLYILEGDTDEEKSRRLTDNVTDWTDRLLQELEDEYEITGDEIYFALAKKVLEELHPEQELVKDENGVSTSTKSLLSDLEPVIETFVWLLIVIFIMAIIAERMKLPYTIVLVLAGLIAGSLPVLKDMQMSHDLVFFLFLPPLLFEGAIHMRFDHLKKNMKAIVIYATVGVALSIMITGGLVFLMNDVAGLALSAVLCLLFASLISATDPVSVLSIVKRIGAPKRLSVILEGESLFNDGTAVVFFTIIYAIATGEATGNWLMMVWTFIKMVAVGGALGFGIGYAASLITLRINDHLIEITLSTIVAYGTFLVAEALHVSGVIAVVAAGITIGNFGFEMGMSPTTRLSMRSFWDYAAFLINSLVFLLVGIQVKFSVLADYWIAVLIAIAAVLVSRSAVIYGLSPIIRWFDRKIPFKYQHVLIWGGLRGALSMALALSLAPNEIGMFPTQEILAMTFGVAIFSLLVQGLTVGGLVRKLGLVTHDPAQKEIEIATGRLTMLYGALEELASLHQQRAILPEVEFRLRKELKEQINKWEEEVDRLQEVHGPVVDEQMKVARREIIKASKSDLMNLRQTGTIGEDVYKDLVRELDEQLDKLRMKGEE